MHFQLLFMGLVSLATFTSANNLEAAEYALSLHEWTVGAVGDNFYKCHSDDGCFVCSSADRANFVATDANPSLDPTPSISVSDGTFFTNDVGTTFLSTDTLTEFFHPFDCACGADVVGASSLAEAIASISIPPSSAPTAHPTSTPTNNPTDAPTEAEETLDGTTVVEVGARRRHLLAFDGDSVKAGLASAMGEDTSASDVTILSSTDLGSNMWEVNYRIKIRASSAAAAQAKKNRFKAKKDASSFAVPGFVTRTRAQADAKIAADVAAAANSMVGNFVGGGGGGDFLQDGASCTADSQCANECWGGLCVEGIKAILPMFASLAYYGGERRKSVYGFDEVCSTENRHQGGIFVNDAKKVIVMTVRGTADSDDVVTNSRMALGSMDYEEKVFGVTVVAKSERWVKEENRYAAAKAIRAAGKSDYQLLLTGHSMGGGIVLALADKYKNQFSGWVYNPYCHGDTMDQPNVNISQGSRDFVISGAGAKCDCAARRAYGNSCSHSDYGDTSRDIYSGFHSSDNYLTSSQVTYRDEIVSSGAKC